MNQNLVIFKVIPYKRESADSLSPFDKLEYIFQESEVQAYSLKLKNYLYYIKKGYIYVKFVGLNYEMKNILNFKVSNSFDKIVITDRLILFNSNDISDNKVLSLHEKSNKRESEVWTLQKVESRFRYMLTAGSARALIFEDSFIYIFKETLCQLPYKINFAFYFGHLLFIQTPYTLKAILPYFTILDQPVEVVVSKDQFIKRSRLKMVRFINERLLVLDENFEISFVDITDDRLLFSLYMEMGLMEKALAVANRKSLALRFYIAQVLYRCGKVKLLTKLKEFDLIIVDLLNFALTNRNSYFKEFMQICVAFYSFLDNKQIKKSFMQTIEDKVDEVSLFKQQYQLK